MLPEWFLPLIMGDTPAMREAAKAFMEAFFATLRDEYMQPSVVVHRDFHADNLFWLAQEHGIRRVAMLDFQDALLGHPAYDLVSLLEDARRDADAEVVSTYLEQFISLCGLDEPAFRQAYAFFFGMQRNAKIFRHFHALMPTRWQIALSAFCAACLAVFPA